ncbi:MAG: segregation/condensation protein A [Tissierellia bacterium]|nr:segregation/condensation protein A [Tissierellia bacterium]
MINVRTGEFYGPFDLLLELIEKSKMDIYNIQLSDITNSYIEQINTIDIPAQELTDFILIAASLLHIKTKTLVKDSLVLEEEAGEEELSKEDLIRRLIEYKRIKKLAILLRQDEKIGLKKYTKLQEDLSSYAEEETDQIVYDKEVLKLIMDSIILNTKMEDDFKVEKILNISEYSLEEYSEKIKLDLFSKKILSISKMLKKVSNKSEAIIIFLSILELSKNKKLTISQDSINKEIIVRSCEDDNEQ